MTNLEVHQIVQAVSYHFHKDFRFQLGNLLNLWIKNQGDFPSYVDCRKRVDLIAEIKGFNLEF